MRAATAAAPPSRSTTCRRATSRGATATSGNTQVTLAWTNPADSDLGTILVLRRAGSAVGDTPTEGATYSVGNAIGSSTVACVVTAPATGCTDSGLTNGTVYHYKIFANDTNGNYAIGVVPTGSPVTPNVTTLGNGTEPANATIAPGGAATMADAFTFQTGSGTDAITAVTVTLAPGTSAGVSLVEITNDAGSIVYGSVSDPSSDTPAIPLTTPITATTTSHAVQDPRHAEESCGDAGAPRGELRADSFVQLVAGKIGLPEGRYLVREDDVERVLIVQELEAPRPQRRGRRRARPVAPEEPEQVPVTRVTVTGGALR